MDQFLEWLYDAVVTVNSYLADYILIVLLIGVGLFYTIKTRFVQIRCFGQGMKNVFGNIKLKGGKQKSGMSSFQAFATAVAAQVGTGNIIGASGAILTGGPGAIFWMWIIAFLGMATIYAEAVLAQKTKEIDAEGNVQGGPVYYIKQAFKGKFGKFLAGFFAVAIVVALGFIGSMVQSNSIGEAVSNATGIPTWVVGIVIAILAALIFIGGTSRLASVTEKIVPIMALIYIVGSLIVIGCKITDLPQAFGMIFRYAFTPQAIIGGSFGAALKIAISQGAKRGLFSNEAGMGSTPHAHAQANVKTAHEQGTVAIVGVFIDTFIVLTLTSLVVIITLYAGNGILSTGVIPENISKNNLVATAVSSIFTDASLGVQIGSIFVAICLTFFAFSTIISWNMFGKINFNYLFKKKGTIIYSIISILFILLGSFLKNDLVWELTDFFNYLMVLPNVVALFCLSKMVVGELKTNGKKSAVDTPNQPLDNKLN
ncbi:MAG: sodium:alanine symporter family protein [Clostridiales bacterium]|nr:sodium:alanine symporter family protein [Clostridiales bacterium]